MLLEICPHEDSGLHMLAVVLIEAHSHAHSLQFFSHDSQFVNHKQAFARHRLLQCINISDRYTGFAGLVDKIKSVALMNVRL